jgi:hypothetical protein
VSFIGSLEQFDLANILRRLEAFTKTGLLVVKQEEIWVEFYFRQGQLVCIGPMRANATLLDRLLQASLLSQQSLPQVRALIDPSEANETRIALALINGGYLSREVLRAWASHETSQILRAVLGWPAGDIYFAEERSTPPDRLLVALSISILLDALQTVAPSIASMGAPSNSTPAPGREPSTRSNPVASVPIDAGGHISAASLLDQSSAPGQTATGSAEGAGLLNAAQLIDDLPFNFAGASHMDQSDETPPSIALPAPAKISFGAEIDISASNQVSLLPPQPVPHPLPPARIDTSFMTPDLVLVPVDLSSLREHNPQVQLTPDQWRLFALVDGQTALQMFCQALMASAEQVRAVAGELMAIGLVMPQPTGSFHKMPASMVPAAAPDVTKSAPGQYAGGPAPRSTPPVGAAPFTPPTVAQSRWGHSAAGTPFVVGGNWVLSGSQVAPQPANAQPGMVYAPLGRY